MKGRVGIINQKRESGLIIINGSTRIFKEKDARVTLYGVQLSPVNWSDPQLAGTAVPQEELRHITIKAMIWP